MVTPCSRGCCSSFAEHVRSVAFAPSTMPNRHPNAVEKNRMEARWERDMPAFKRLCESGVEPTTTEGCADMEARAETRVEVEQNQVIEDRATRKLADEIYTHKDQIVGSPA